MNGQTVEPTGQEKGSGGARRRRLWIAVLLAGLLAGAVGTRWGLHAPTGTRSGEVARAGIWVKDGLYFQAGHTNPFTGCMVERYDIAGGIKSRSTITNGVLEGISEGWHTNGQRQVREEFHCGVAQGLRTKWHENGNVLSEASIVDGKLHGRFRRWHDNGQLAEEIQLDMGVPHGLSRAFYPSGSPKAQATLEQGKLVTQQFWQDGGMAVSMASSLPTPVR